jgi:hypothetical protein
MVGVGVAFRMQRRFWRRLAAVGADFCVRPVVRWYVCRCRMGGVSLLTPWGNCVWMPFSHYSLERVRWVSVFAHVIVSIWVWVCGIKKRYLHLTRLPIHPPTSTPQPRSYTHTHFADPCMPLNTIIVPVFLLHKFRSLRTFSEVHFDIFNNCGSTL